MLSPLTSAALVVSVLATSVLASPKTKDGSAVSSTAAAAAPTASVIWVNLTTDFSPNTVIAQVGDWVEFPLSPGLAVVRGDVNRPCWPYGYGDTFTGLYSGQPASPVTWRFRVNDMDPIVLYSTNPCKAAMVINPPSTGNGTLAAWRDAASKQDAYDKEVGPYPVIPGEQRGGVFGPPIADSINMSVSNASVLATATATINPANISFLDVSATAAATGVAARNGNGNSLGLGLAGAAAVGIAALW